MHADSGYHSGFWTPQNFRAPHHNRFRALRDKDGNVRYRKCWKLLRKDTVQKADACYEVGCVHVIQRLILSLTAHNQPLSWNPRSRMNDRRIPLPAYPNQYRHSCNVEDLEPQCRYSEAISRSHKAPHKIVRINPNWFTLDIRQCKDLH